MLPATIERTTGWTVVKSNLGDALQKTRAALEAEFVGRRVRVTVSEGPLGTQVLRADPIEQGLYPETRVAVISTSGRVYGLKNGLEKFLSERQATPELADMVALCKLLVFNDQLVVSGTPTPTLTQEPRGLVLRLTSIDPLSGEPCPHEIIIPADGAVRVELDEAANRALEGAEAVPINKTTALQRALDSYDAMEILDAVTALPVGEELTPTLCELLTTAALAGPERITSEALARLLDAPMGRQALREKMSQLSRDQRRRLVALAEQIGGAGVLGDTA